DRAQPWRGPSPGKGAQATPPRNRSSERLPSAGRASRSSISFRVLASGQSNIYQTFGNLFTSHAMSTPFLDGYSRCGAADREGIGWSHDAARLCDEPGDLPTEVPEVAGRPAVPALGRIAPRRGGPV